MEYPSLDADFHWESAIHPDDLRGQAQVCLTVGAPFLSTPRQFWARLARPLRLDDWHHVLLRPVESHADQISLSQYAFYCPHEPTDADLEKFWQHDIHSDQYGNFPLEVLCRYWRHSNGGTCVLFRAGIGPILHRLEIQNGETHIRTGDSYGEPQQKTWEELVFWPTRDFHDFLQDRFDDPKSELRRTWEWLLLSSAQKRDAFYMCRRGSWNEALRVLACLLASEALFNDDIAQFGAGWSLLDDKDLLLRSEPLRRTALSPRLANWRREILAFYDVMGIGDNVPKLIAKHPISTASYIGCQPLSHDDAREAHLYLVQWAEHHLAASIVDELLALDS